MKKKQITETDAGKFLEFGSLLGRDDDPGDTAIHDYFNNLNECKCNLYRECILYLAGKIRCSDRMEIILNEIYDIVREDEKERKN